MVTIAQIDKEIGGSVPQLTAEEQEIVDKFHKLYYDRMWFMTPYLKNYGQVLNTLNTWAQSPVFKSPFDTWAIQEIITDTAPDIIVESGTACGGSALYMATVCDLLGRGRILTIDIEGKDSVRPIHRRIDYLCGDILSAKPAIEDYIKVYNGERIMFVFDDNHCADHVFAEMELFADLVTPHCYMIVEDGNINGHPVRPEYGPGPLEAIEKFLPFHPEFIVDESREKKFLFSFNPKGYLFKTKPEDWQQK